MTMPRKYVAQAGVYRSGLRNARDYFAVVADAAKALGRAVQEGEDLPDWRTFRVEEEASDIASDMTMIRLSVRGR